MTIQILIFFSRLESLRRLNPIRTQIQPDKFPFHHHKSYPQGARFQVLWSQIGLFQDEYIINRQCYSLGNVSPILRFRKPRNQRDRFLDWRGGQNHRSHFWGPFQPVSLLRFEAAKDEERLQQMLDGTGLHRHHFSVNFDHWSIQEKVIKIFFSKIVH